MTFTTVNDAPVNTVAGDPATIEANSDAIAALAIADVDANAATLTTTLSVDHGTLALAALGGAAVRQRHQSVQITGTLAAINATLRRRQCHLQPVTGLLRQRHAHMVTR